MSVKIKLPFNTKDLKIRCPYCEKESFLNSWCIWVEPIARMEEDELKISYIYSNAECPICETIIDTWEVKKVDISNTEDLKKAIENYSVDITRKLIQCPSCKKWNNFYDWEFRGFIEKLYVDVLNQNEVDFKEEGQEIFITKAVCWDCKYEIPIDTTKVHIPMSDEDIKLLVERIKKAVY